MDFEKMAQFLEMMNLLMEEPPGAPEPAPDMTRQASPFPGFQFHDAGPSPALETIQMAMPYLDYRYQRSFGMVLKLMEIQRMIEMYGAQAYAGGATADWRRRLLLGIRPHVEENRRYMVDLLLKLMEIRQILDHAPGRAQAVGRQGQQK